MDLFQEPEDFYQPEKEATFASHQLLSGKELKIRLVGHNPLWVSDPKCEIFRPFDALIHLRMYGCFMINLRLMAVGTLSLECWPHYSTLF